MGAKRRTVSAWICRVLHTLFMGLALLAAGLFVLRLLLVDPLARGIGYKTPKTRELLPPEPIDAVMEREGQIYVLYGGTAVVDVYDSAGQFLWAVSVPYHDHNEDAKMKVEGGSLFLYQVRHQVYEYRCTDGRFLGSFDQEAEAERFPGGGYQTRPVQDGEATAGTLYFKHLQVLRGDTSGGFVPVISHSRWWELLYFHNIWLLGFSSGVALFLLEHIRLPKLALKQARQERGAEAKIRPKSQGTKIFLKHARITVAVDLAYLAVNLTAVLGFHSASLSIGIIPVALWFIGSNIVVGNRVEKQHLWGTDALLVQKWRGYLWASFIAAFVSVMAGSLLRH